MNRPLPTHLTELDLVPRTRAAIAQAWVGAGFTAGFGCIYALSGSPLSGAAILFVFAGLLLVPAAVRRGVPIEHLGNALVALTWLATCVVASRSGGLSSPAIAWNFLFPLATYAVCGRRAALVWAWLAGFQIGTFYLADVLGLAFAQDFSPRMLSILRVCGYAGVIATVVILLSMMEAARRAAFEAIDAENRTRERARILDDMHDGVGSQLSGLIVQLRGARVRTTEVIRTLEDCLADLRLIVASLDSVDLELEHALGDLRVRSQARFAAAGIELRWTVDVAPLRSDGAWVTQALRALQEMLANALRHSGTDRVDVEVGLSNPVETDQAPGRPAFLALSVRDYGRGLDSTSQGRGRGLSSLRARAKRLGGTFAMEPAEPGVRARFVVPRA